VGLLILICILKTALGQWFVHAVDDECKCNSLVDIFMDMFSIECDRQTDRHTILSTQVTFLGWDLYIIQHMVVGVVRNSSMDGK
jgi:hypothetical protein